MRFVAQPRRVRSRCVAAGVRSCQGVEAFATLSLWPAGSATHIAIGHGAPTRMPPLGLDIVPCRPCVKLGAVAHLDDCVWSGHYWRCVAVPRQLAH